MARKVTKGLGRIQSTDARDREHLMRAVLRREILPASRHWYVPPPLEQFATATCVGHAWKHFLLASPLNTKTGPDARTIYREATKIDEWPENDNDTLLEFGTSVRAGAKVLQSRGHLSEYLWAFNAGEVKRFVLSRGPVVLGTDWFEGCYETDEKGYVQLTGGVMGGHAYLCHGYSATRKAFRCLNSWGEWGDKQTGKFWLKEADLEELMRRDGEAASAIEIKVLP